MAEMGSVTVNCPVCGKPWVVKITGAMVPRHGRPGEANTKVSVVKPIRVPREHRSCIKRAH